MIDADRIEDIDSIYAVIGAAVNGPGGYFGQGLDWLNDCRGGFGTSESVRSASSGGHGSSLGYPDTCGNLSGGTGSPEVH